LTAVSLQLVERQSNAFGYRQQGSFVQDQGKPCFGGKSGSFFFNMVGGGWLSQNEGEQFFAGWLPGLRQRLTRRRQNG
jgi:hypothetical protein